MSFSHTAASSAHCSRYEVKSDFLSPSPTSLPHQHLIILNYTLPDFTPHLWLHSRYKILADGGANRFYDLLPQLKPQENVFALRCQFLPDAIVGDLDSIRSDVRDFYESQNVEIRDLSHDQDTTDTVKCLSHLKDRLAMSEEKETVLTVGALGGRLDHTLANLNTLHRFPDLEIVMMGEGNCTRLIKTGKTLIKIHSAAEGPKCAIVPLDRPATVTATGLKWPLNRHCLEFSGLISTSNSLVSDEVVIETDHPVLWIISLNEDVLYEELKKQF